MSALAVNQDTQSIHQDGNIANGISQESGRKIIPLPAPKVDRTREYQEDAARSRVLAKLAKKVDTDTEFDSSKLPSPPLEQLPTFLREFCVTAAIASESNETMVLPFALTALAGTIGSTVELQVKPGHREPSVLWTAIVAHTGAHKSPAMHHAFAPISEWEREMKKKYDEAKKRYEVELDNWNATPKAERGLKPSLPIRSKLKVTDSTLEALSSTLADNPRGLIWTADELLGFVGGLNQYKGGHGSDRAKVLELWNCKPVSVLRQGKEVYLERPALNMTGGIQPGVLHEMSPGNREDGFLERFLMVVAKNEAQKNNRSGFDPRPIDEWKAIIRRMIDAFSIDSSDELQVAKFSAQAQERWFDLSDAHRQKMRQMPIKALGVAQKIEGYAARLALVLHMARYFAEETRNLYILDCQDVDSAWALARWFQRNAMLARGLMSLSDEDRLVAKVVSWIRKHGGEATLRELVHGKALGRGVTKVDLQAVLDRAQDAGVVTATQSEADRRTVTYGLLKG